MLLPLLPLSAAAADYATDQSSSMAGRASMSGGTIADHASSGNAAPRQNTVSAAAPAATVSDKPSAPEDLIPGLIKQASFWHEKNQYDKAIQTLNRVLISDPKNQEALYLMASWSYEIGSNDTAKIYRDRLYKLAPNSSYIIQLDNQKNIQALSADQLKHARSLAASGNVTAALLEYQKLFSGSQPPKELVSEYYLVMSGDNNFYQRAVDGIVSYIKKNPNDTAAQITYGKLLSYRPSSIRRGIEILDYYAPKSDEADKAERQALMWLSPEQSDEKYYKSYAARHPNDNLVTKHFDDIVVGAIVNDAYSKTDSDKEQAIEDFKKILERNPMNQEALEAIGYLYNDLKNYAQAQNYLNQAAALGGVKQPKLSHDAAMAGCQMHLAQKNYALALSELDKLLKATPGDHDALLLKADILKKQGRRAEAEIPLRSVLAGNPADEAAGEMLYYLYREQGKTRSAEELLASLPPELADKIKRATAAKAYVDPIPPIRARAASYDREGNPAMAVEELQRGISRYPNATWLHYDLGSLHHQQGFEEGALRQIAYLTRQGASDEDLLAGATLANDCHRYKEALQTVSRMRQSTTRSATLRKTLIYNAGVMEAEEYLRNGNRTAALNTLASLNLKPGELTVSQLSHEALLYQQAGNRARAVELANLARARPISSNASLADYADLITVLNETGNYAEARALSSDQRLIANSRSSDINSLEVGERIRKADALRENSRYADAYDELYPLISQDPDNAALQMAMARIYADNGMNDEAFALYDAVLQKDPNSTAALEGAMNAAMGNNDQDLAEALAERLEDSADPKVLVMLAKVDVKGKRYNSAMDKLARARAMLDGRYAGTASSPSYLGLNSGTLSSHQAGNPFSNKVKTRQNEKRDANLPWLYNGPQESDVSFSFNDMKPQDRKATLTEITTMMRDLRERTSPSVVAGVEARQKDGEDGLSSLSSVSAPVTISTPVLGGSKLSFTVTPNSMDAGTMSPSAAAKFGTNILQVGVQNMVTSINNIRYAYRSMLAGLESTLTADEIANRKSDFKKQYGLNTLSDATFSAIVGGTTADSVDLLDSANLSVLSAAGRQNLIGLFNNLGSTDSIYTVMAAIRGVSQVETMMSDFRAKRNNGVGFSFALADDDYKVDLGVTPVGKDSTTVVGGLYYAYPLSSTSQLRFNLERRAMEDSVLSYYGFEDRLSGTYWGGVTKNGGSIEYASDDGYFGTSLKGSYYRYTGENVLDNSSFGADALFYVHPYRPTANEDMTIGFSLSYENFQHNENHFSFGHGGYFSPQSYFRAAVPFSYRKKTDDWTLAIDAALGYQSYKEQEEDYFPTNSTYQSYLNTLKNFGFVSSSRYDSKNERGVGGSATVKFDYNILDDLVVGGAVNYNTFGDYNELYEMIYIKSILGG